jgi:hypothetical protein
MLGSLNFVNDLVYSKAVFVTTLTEISLLLLSNCLCLCLSKCKIGDQFKGGGTCTIQVDETGFAAGSSISFP